MYTVARFSSVGASREILDEIGQALNAVRPGIYEGFSHKRNRFGCSVSTDPAWPAHDQAIRAFMADCREVVQRALASGIVVQFDVMVDAEDREAAVLYVVVVATPRLMQVLGAAGVDFVVSCYKGDSSENVTISDP